MKCPYCGNIEDKVIETRESRDNHYIRRRRECLKCEKRYTTYEKLEDVHLMVVKKDGRREEFDLDKVKKGLSDKEIITKAIGEYNMEKLRNLDKVAYVRFASVYFDFKSLEEFLNELHSLLKKEE